MSQAGEIDVIGNHPQIPILFVTDSGNAVPIANTLEILATTVAAGTTPIETTGSGNTVTIEVQRSQAIAATDATKVGLSVFDSGDFAVDANGFVQLAGAGAGQTITGQSGGALSPTAGNWNIFGASTAAGTSPVTTSGAVSTLTVNVQKAQALAATDANKVGLANFDSGAFAVDANGFVTLKGGGEAIDSIAVQTGTSPIAPTAAGLVTLNGSVVAAGTNPVRTDGTGANTAAIEVQISQAIAATDATKIGLSNYNSAQFSVDANGFVSLAGGGLAIDSISPNSGTDPIVPDANGKVSIVGTGSVTTVGSLNTETIQLTGLTNHAVLVGAGTATITNVGPTATAGQVLQSAGAAADPAFSTATYPLTTTINQILYSSAANTVTGLASANRGVVTTSSTGVPVVTAINGNGLLIIGSGSSQPAAANLTAGTGVSIVNAANSITINAAASVATSYNADSGSATPSANVLTLSGSGSIATSASGSTVTTALTGLTNHNVLIGAGTATITKVAPSATSGVPLISQGAAVDPVFGTAVVAGGGTGNTTFTAYSLIAAGTTATGAFQNVSGVGTSGQVLTSNGAAALPTWQSAPASVFTSVNVQTFSASGTYTPTAGMLYCIIECVGSGGGGGGTSTCTATQVSVGGGGGGAGYSSKFASAATIGASQTVTIGTVGTAGAVGGGSGGNGGSTSVGTICVANGGSGGVGSAATTAVLLAVSGGSALTGGTGDIVSSGGAGGYGVGSSTSGYVASGIGGCSFFCGSANAVVGGGAANGNAGNNYGGGGSGGGTAPSNTQKTGGAGSGGFVRITEFI